MYTESTFFYAVAEHKLPEGKLRYVSADILTSQNSAHFTSVGYIHYILSIYMFQLVQLMVFLGPIGMQLVPLYRCNLWYFWTPLVRSWCHYTGATYGISGPHWYAAGATIQVKHMVFLDPIVMQLVPLLR